MRVECNAFYNHANGLASGKEWAWRSTYQAHAQSVFATSQSELVSM